MSEQATQQPSMTYDDAYNLLNGEVFVPTFMHKLAEYGIHPKSQEELAEYLQLNARLVEAEQRLTVKAASDRVGVAAAANQALDRLLGRPVQEQQAPAYNEQEVQKVAADLASNPYLRNAALLWQDALRQQVQS